MARRPRSSLEHRSYRLKLAARRKPYEFTPIAPGIALGYRRCAGAGRWVVRVADGHGSSWTKGVGIADDHEEADGEHVFTFWQAQDRARKLARGSDADVGRPATVKDAVDAYEDNLRARGGSLRNVGRIRKHLTPTLASKPVGLATTADWERWKKGLLDAGMKRQTALRLFKATKAALNLAARRDRKRIRNVDAWRDGLGGLGNTFETRNATALSDAQVNKLIRAANAEDAAFGLYVWTLAETGARPSQVARLIVADLQSSRLMMPSSRKGGPAGHRKPTKSPVPISAKLAEKLKATAEGRASHEPLLRRADRKAWNPDVSDHHWPLQATLKRAGFETTLYSLRHSSITRSLLAGVPTRVTAALHDTSVKELEATYSAFILDHADEVARRGLLKVPAGIEGRPT